MGLKLHAEDDLRAGRNPNLLMFPPNERREIARNARFTPLQARFARLPMAEAASGAGCRDRQREGRAIAGVH